MYKPSFHFLLLFAVLSCTGCDNSPFRTEPVQGTVTFDSKPLAGAVVSFTVQEGSPGKSAYAQTDEQGRYVLTASEGGRYGKGTMAGKYDVSIIKEVMERQPTAKEISDLHKGIAAYSIPNVSVIPKKYTDPKTAGLTAEVVRGKNTINFDLTSE